MTQEAVSIEPVALTTADGVVLQGQVGHRVMTFDLRGMGASRGSEHRQSLRGLDADRLTWARRDFPAAVNALSAPVLTPLFGYFPGKALRMVGDLPAPAMRQWSRWCRHPEFAWGAEPDQVMWAWSGSGTPAPFTVRVPMHSGQCSSKLS